MKLQTPKTGLYDVLSISTELHNGKLTPVAEVCFKELEWNKFSSDIHTIRLRGLYNPSSIGPKDEFPYEQLQYLYIHIKAMEIKINPKNPSKQLYTVIWEVIEPLGNDEYVAELKAIEGDFKLQEMAFSEANKEIVNILKIDEVEKQILASRQ